MGRVPLGRVRVARFPERDAQLEGAWGVLDQPRLRVAAWYM